MIYLDTHVVVWLYAGLLEKFSSMVKNLLNENELWISPIVRLELQYLYEIDRVGETANVIVADLANRIGIQVSEKGFDAVVSKSMIFTWTRDPFDRLIVANAALDDCILITKDQTIQAHYPYAKW